MSPDLLRLKSNMSSGVYSTEGNEEVKSPQIVITTEESKVDQAFFGASGNTTDKEFVDVFSAGPSQLP